MVLRYLERLVDWVFDFYQEYFNTLLLSRTNEAPKPTVALDYNYAKKPKNIDTVNSLFLSSPVYVDECHLGY